MGLGATSKIDSRDEQDSLGNHTVLSRRTRDSRAQRQFDIATTWTHTSGVFPVMIGNKHGKLASYSSIRLWYVLIRCTCNQANESCLPNAWLNFTYLSVCSHWETPCTPILTYSRKVWRHSYSSRKKLFFLFNYLNHNSTHDMYQVLAILQPAVKGMSSLQHLTASGNAYINLAKNHTQQIIPSPFDLPIGSLEYNDPQ